MSRLVSILRSRAFCYGGKSSRHLLNAGNYRTADLKLDQLSKSFTSHEELGPTGKPRKFGRDPHQEQLEPHQPPEFLKPGEKPDEFEVICYKLHFIRINNLGYKLKLSALYMQATEGPNPEPEPPKDHHFEHAYWTAWKALGNMSKEEARSEYIRLGKQRMEKRDPDIVIND